jgi:flavin reductase (DIM6/NTAB) family NADH-FMN oxidoreductase RutF
MNTKKPFDPLDFRKALGSFGTGVTIVTSQALDKSFIGLTVNSFSSVSLDPAIVLWSLQKSSPNLPAFDACGHFVINVLSLAQIEHSRRFAKPIPDKFNGIAYRLGLTGLPVLEGCAATFECQTLQRIDVGDHVLYLGQVEAYSHQEQSALLYVQGKYAQGTSVELQHA